MTYKKKLIEVALPLASINDASAYDKMPGIGPHPKGLHHWWARLPLPAARAILFASLVDDPSSDLNQFPNKEAEDTERRRLFGLMESLLCKRPHESPEAFQRATEEIRRCCANQLPIVMDPFSGGGSIPLEAQRLGLQVIASDLNPVPVLINKVLLELIPKCVDLPPINRASDRTIVKGISWKGATGLAEDVRYYGAKIFDALESELGAYYPKVIDQSGTPLEVIAWIWVRSVQCINPACEAGVPLARSFTLASGKRTASHIEVSQNRADLSRPVFTVKRGKEGKLKGTMKKGGAECPFCGQRIDFRKIRELGRDGRITQQLMSIVASGDAGRRYLSPDRQQEDTALSVPEIWQPDTELPDKALGFRVQAYGITNHRDLYTKRQLATLARLSELVSKIGTEIDEHAKSAGTSYPREYAVAIQTLLAMAVDRCADFSTSLNRWGASNEKVMSLWGRQTLSMLWDFAEANLLGHSVGSWTTCLKYVARCVEVVPIGQVLEGRSLQVNAAEIAENSPLAVVSTDPPYYDNIGYAALSDLFYVWLRRALGGTYDDLFATVLTPKSDELVADPARFENDPQKAKEHFEEGFKKTFTRLRRFLDPRYPMTVYYAFRQEETTSTNNRKSGTDLTTGWETLLEAVLTSGFQINATWPIRASQKWRMRSRAANALGSYIVLACRPRDEDAPQTTRRDFLSKLEEELPRSITTLLEGNIAPVDLAQAAIGPGMSVFSRFSQVIEADGSPMRVRTALSLINQVLDEAMAERDADFDPDTRWALAWFEEFGHDEGPYDRAEVLAKAKNTSVAGLVQAGILRSSKGTARILSRSELQHDWDPRSDSRLTIWEVAQHLIRQLENSELNAAEVLRGMGAGYSESTRQLAYLLFEVCERRGWAQEAVAYNGLIVAWPELARLATTGSGTPTQQTLGDEEWQ